MRATCYRVFEDEKSDASDELVKRKIALKKDLHTNFVSEQLNTLI